MPKRLILVRHGHTDHNKKKILQGWLNTELDEAGLDQAKKVAQRLSSQSFEVVYSSDLKRALSTAELIAANHKLKVIPTPTLRESNLGILQGMDWLDKNHPLYSLWQEHIQANLKADLHWKKHQGESLAEIYDRLGKLMSILHRKHKNKSVLLVTHGGTINRLLEFLHLRKLTDDFLSFGNTSVTILTKTSPSQYKITLLNDTSHLSQP